VTTTLVRPARPDDLAGLPALEEASDALFARHGVGPLPPVTTTTADLAEAEQVLVAEDASGLVGFARLEVVDGQAHLEQLSVHPDATGRGVGTALLEASAAWAARAGHEALTLCTFADVPWNGPFYARHGYVELDPLPARLEPMRETELRMGMDRHGRRIAMVRDLTAR
jgi:GNAT superfamily N-acetyltransferase